METLPEPQDPIKSLLSWFMSEEDVARYSDLSYVLETIRKRELCWQAAVSIGVHAFDLRDNRDEEQARVENLVGSALEPLEARHQSLTQQASQQPLTDEQGRMLFHVRFGLGWLLWLKGDQERSKGTLHDMAATKLSWSRGWSRSGGDIVPYTDDLARAKQLTAIFMSILHCQAEDYDEALYLIEQAADTPEGGEFPLGLAGGLLDRWAAKCERVEQEEEWAPWLEWMTLLYRVAEILPVCSYADTSGAPPGECDKSSAQFIAYKLGQMAATFAAKMADDWPDYVAQAQHLSGEDYLLHGLLCEHAICSDWRKARKAFMTWWELTPCYPGIPPEEIGPHTDLYWAVRIGFADRMLESTQAVVLSAEPVPTTPAVPSVEALIDTIRGMDRKLDERLPRSGRELRQRVMRHLIPVADLVPLKVLNVLTKGEKYRDSQDKDDEAKVCFVKGVEAALDDCLVGPLVEFMKQQGKPRVDLPFPAPRGLERREAPGLRKLNLREWADLLDTLMPARRSLSALGAGDLRDFLNQHIGSHWPDFRPLAQSLRRVQELRSGSAHYQQAETRLEKELWELEEMRKLVLGLDNSPSVIAQIYRLLAPSRQS